MGAAMTRRLMRDGHECVVCDLGRAQVDELESGGVVGASSLSDLVAQLSPPRSVGSCPVRPAWDYNLVRS